MVFFNKLPNCITQKVEREPDEHSLELLTKTIAEIYWSVTEDVRIGASKMEDVISHGTVCTCTL